MNAKTLILAFAPLVVFTVGSHLVGPLLIGWVALACAVLGLALVLTGLRQGVKLITLASTIIFALLAAIALFGGTPGQTFVGHYGSGACALIIGALMLVSAATVPFTEQYARAEVPRDQWGSPTFRLINKRISISWGGAVGGIGLSRLAYGYLLASGQQMSMPLQLALAWGAPILLIVVALNATKKIAADTEQDRPQPPAASAPTTPS